MNILLVEDDYNSREYLAKFLGMHNHDVDKCENGKKALKLFKNSIYHLVLTDIKMPEMDGLELLRQISSLPSGQEVHVVLFTGYGDIHLAIEALRAGAYDYMLKPINLDELVAVIERISEHLALRKENRVLTEKFNDVVKEATREKQEELDKLKKAYAGAVGIDDIVICSEQMKNVMFQATKLHTDRSIPVLIQGETGTGKEVIAKCIHYGDLDVTTPFIDINCASLSPSLFESELFGYEAGSFTGGISGGNKGKIDIARGGTLFLDEITELPNDLQAKLLRFLQEKEYYRVGGLKKIKADVRIICATNVNIEQKVDEGSFRQDLYYRINVGKLIIPPLRERKDDILPLAKDFLLNLAKQKKKRLYKISDPACQVMLNYNWPGNVRELKNVIERAVFMYEDTELKPFHLNALTTPQPSNDTLSKVIPVSGLERFSMPSDGFDIENHYNNIIQKALEIHNGNKSQTARYLGISRHKLYHRLLQMKQK